MSDLISKEKLLESLIYCKGLGRRSFEAVMETIKEQPTVEPVRGEWITRYKYSDIYYCSNCGNEAYWDTDYGQQLFDFCQCCGADMRGEKND